MLVGMLMNAVQAMIADKGQTLMKEHVLDKFTEHLDDDAKKELDEHFARCIAEGIVTGKNADLRKGDHATKFPEFYLAVNKAEMELAEDKLNLDLARLDEDHLKMLMRLDELRVRTLHASDFQADVEYPE